MTARKTSICSVKSCATIPVRVATSGEKALKIVYSDEPPDLILLDIMMPGISGLEICRRLKANPDRRRIPIIFVTAMSSTEDERRGAGNQRRGLHYQADQPAHRDGLQAHPPRPLRSDRAELANMVAQRTTELLTTASRSSAVLGRPPSSATTKPATMLRMSHYARLIALPMASARSRLSSSTPPRCTISARSASPTPSCSSPASSMRPSGGDVPASDHGCRDHRRKHDNELLGNSPHHRPDPSREIRWQRLPQGLKGRAIPLEGRIVAIADVFDALVSCAPTSPALPLETALQYFDEQSGAISTPPCSSPSKAPAEILRIKEIYADENGALTDLEFHIKEIYDHKDDPTGYPEIPRAPRAASTDGPPWQITRRHEQPEYRFAASAA